MNLFETNPDQYVCKNNLPDIRITLATANERYSFVIDTVDLYDESFNTRDEYSTVRFTCQCLSPNDYAAIMSKATRRFIIEVRNEWLRNNSEWEMVDYPAKVFDHLELNHKIDETSTPTKWEFIFTNDY